MREWKYRRIINKILPCTLCPCKTGHFQVWLQSTATLWRGAPYAPILYLDNFLPRFSSFLTICFFLILYISFSSCPAQAAGSKLLAQLPFVVVFFCLVFCRFCFVFLPAMTGSLYNHFPPEHTLLLTKYTFPVFQRIPTSYRHPPLLKGTGRKTENK